MFGRKQKNIAFDPERQTPVLRCSICTGEQVACFRDKASGRLEEIMLIRNAKDMEAFCRRYGIGEPVEKIY